MTKFFKRGDPASFMVATWQSTLVERFLPKTARIIVFSLYLTGCSVIEPRTPPAPGRVDIEPGVKPATPVQTAVPAKQPEKPAPISKPHLEPPTQPRPQPAPAKSPVIYLGKQPTTLAMPVRARTAESPKVMAAANDSRPTTTLSKTSATVPGPPATDPPGALIFTGANRRELALATPERRTGGRGFVWFGVGIFLAGLASLGYPPIRTRLKGLLIKLLPNGGGQWIDRSGKMLLKGAAPRPPSAPFGDDCRRDQK